MSEENQRDYGKLILLIAFILMTALFLLSLYSARYWFERATTLCSITQIQHDTIKNQYRIIVKLNEIVDWRDKTVDKEITNKIHNINITGPIDCGEYLGWE